MQAPCRRILCNVLVFCFVISVPRIPYCQTGTATVSIDATDAARKIFHSHMVIPAKPGSVTLYYPKWIPGEHGPTGPIVNLAGLKFVAGGKQISWKRDSVDMNAFHIDIPQGANAVEVDLDFLSPTGQNGFTDAASATPHLAMISWNTLLLYPSDRKPDDIQYAGSIKLPSGWKFGTALPVERNSGDTVDFRPVSLNSLVDSPVLTGE